MRKQKQNARLQQARGHLFICSTFGFCASSVLSPRTPPGVPDFGKKAAFVWAANDCTLQQQIEQAAVGPCDPSRVLAEISVNVAVAGTVLQPGSPSNSDRMADQGSSSCSEGGRASITSDGSDLRASDVEELLAEIKGGLCTTRNVRELNHRLRKPDCRDTIRASGVASSLIALLLSSDLTDDASEGAPRPSSVDETKFQVHDVLEESLAALAVLAELDEAAMVLMTTAEFVAVVTRYLCQGRKEAQENACMLLEKLSLEEDLKETIGASPGVMETLKRMLADEKNPKPIKLATKTLLALCLLRDNRLRAVEAGAVASLVEMLPRARAATAEKALATLELLGTTEEGKEAIISHALAVPVLVELILKVSDRGTEYAAGTLSMMCIDSVTMQEAAVAYGAPTKLLLLIQSECTTRAKRKASQLLKVLHPLWLQEPCNPGSGGSHAIRF